MEEESYTQSMNRLLGEARGPLDQLEDFDSKETEVVDENKSAEEDEKTDFEQNEDGDERRNILRIAALMAVLSKIEESYGEEGAIGRMPGSDWAHDHRLMTMGLPGLAYSRRNRSGWR